MLRSLLAGILALSAASACKGGGDAPAVQPGVTAGKVVELTGGATATRDTAKRALGVGQEVSGDDVIETAADGRVRIVLAHNNATWELGPSRTEKVGDSLAWKQPKQDRPATGVDEATLAAGRHAERSTVTTTNTAPTPPAAQADAPSAAQVPAAATRADAPGAAQAPAPAAAASREPDLQAKGGAPSPPPKAERRKEAPVRSMERAPADTGAPAANDVDGLGSLGVRGGGGGGANRAAESSVIAPDAHVRQIVGASRAALVACLADTASLKLGVRTDGGVARLTFPKGTSEAVQSCIVKVSLGWSFPESYAVKVDVPLAK